MQPWKVRRRGNLGELSFTADKDFCYTYVVAINSH